MVTFSVSIVEGVLHSQSRLTTGQEGQAVGQPLFSLVLQQRLVEVTRSQRVITFPQQS